MSSSGISSTYHLLAASIGLTSSTIFITMNTTLNYIAMPSYLLPALSHSSQHSTSSSSSKQNIAPESSIDLLLRQWELTYATGHMVGPLSAIVSPVAFLTAAATLPSSKQDLKAWYYFAAFCAGLAFPFTVLFILPTNNELYRRAELVRREGDYRNGGAEKGREKGVRGVDTLALIRKCLFLSKTRAVMPLPAIFAALFAITAITCETWQP